ncbi:MAG TPA: Fic family protein [Gammaproteobacteria bacterium]|nr:Fic family protein [Gammaproteobacteria bacterium]
MKIGHFLKQPQGYKAFIPEPFPPHAGFDFPKKLIQKASHATLSLGKLDGVTQLLPDVDFFLFMYICKDAASSSQIEGTKATMVDAIEATSKTSENLPGDVDDILHYIQALNYGLNRLKDFPLCLRLIEEVHKELMEDARASHFSDPGNFRKSQNWIGGTSPSNALFVPPPVHEMQRAMSDLEKFFHQADDILPVVKAGLIHAQFETIHPFLDGNGRTGRMLITLFLWLEKLLDRPVLFLSSYFKKHQKMYYERINGYHDGKIDHWIDFFLDGVIDTSMEAIEVAKKITILRDQDMKKIQSLGKTEAKSAIEILFQLFKLPVINVNKVQEWTGFTRQGAHKAIKRFIDLDILQSKDENKTYGQSYIYRQYVDIFKD